MQFDVNALGWRAVGTFGHWGLVAWMDLRKGSKESPGRLTVVLLSSVTGAP
jgi:hypothetical protein